MQAKLNIYHSLIHSHLNYGAIIWSSSLNKKQRQKLKNIQKKAIRIIHNKKFNAHTSELFYKSKITKIENIFEKECILLLHKHKNKSLPMGTQKLIDNSITKSQIGTRSRSELTFQPKRELQKGNFLYDLIHYWNKFENLIEINTKIGDLKNIINERQNKIVQCTRDKCYTCKN